MRRISSSVASNPIINLNSACYVTINGRPGGNFSATLLAITNTNTSGGAIQFINYAVNNSITNDSIKGINASAATNDGNGSTIGLVWDNQTPTMPFRADYRIALRTHGVTGSGFVSSFYHSNNATSVTANWSLTTIH